MSLTIQAVRLRNKTSEERINILKLSVIFTIIYLIIDELRKIESNESSFLNKIKITRYIIIMKIEAWKLSPFYAKQLVSNFLR